MKLFACMCNQPQRLWAALTPVRAVLQAQPPVSRYGLAYSQGGDVLLVRTPKSSSKPVDLAGPLAEIPTDCAIGQAVDDDRFGGTDNTPPFRFRRWMFAQGGSPNLDAALLFLEASIEIPAAKLGSATSGKAVAFGWGDSSFPSKVLKPGRSPNLLQAPMTITKEAGACVMSADRVCAEAPSAGPCAGDSGGPLVKGKSKVVGVLSTVSSCPRSDGEKSAATYTSGSSVKKWVRDAAKLTAAQRQAAFACQP